MGASWYYVYALYIYVCICMCIYICMYIYIHTCIYIIYDICISWYIPIFVFSDCFWSRFDRFVSSLRPFVPSSLTCLERMWHMDSFREQWHCTQSTQCVGLAELANRTHRRRACGVSSSNSANFGWNRKGTRITLNHIGFKLTRHTTPIARFHVSFHINSW